MKHLGNLHHFLGIKVCRNSQGPFLSPTKYAKDLLFRASMLGCKPCASPCASESVLHTNSSPFQDPTLYRSLAGALQYLTLMRPDLSFAMNHAYQYMHSPTEAHFTALKRIIRYIKGTLNFGILLKRGSF